MEQRFNDLKERLESIALSYRFIFYFTDEIKKVDNGVAIILLFFIKWLTVLNGEEKKEIERFNRNNLEIPEDFLDKYSNVKKIITQYFKIFNSFFIAEDNVKEYIYQCLTTIEQMEVDGLLDPTAVDYDKRKEEFGSLMSHISKDAIFELLPSFMINFSNSLECLGYRIFASTYRYVYDNIREYLCGIIFEKISRYLSYKGYPKMYHQRKNSSELYRLQNEWMHIAKGSDSKLFELLVEMEERKNGRDQNNGIDSIQIFVERLYFYATEEQDFKLLSAIKSIIEMPIYQLFVILNSILPRFKNKNDFFPYQCDLFEIINNVAFYNDGVLTHLDIFKDFLELFDVDEEKTKYHKETILILITIWELCHKGYSLSMKEIPDLIDEFIEYVNNSSRYKFTISKKESVEDMSIIASSMKAEGLPLTFSAPR